LGSAVARTSTKGFSAASMSLASLRGAPPRREGGECRERGATEPGELAGAQVAERIKDGVEHRAIVVRIGRSR
jgi:hypothetical protein